MDRFEVAVVGGGVAGASTACAFATAGSRVCLIERRDLQRDPNRGDLLHPQALASLQAWAALDELRARGAIDVRATRFVDASGGRIFEIAHDRPMLALRHAEIEEALTAVAVRHGVQLLRAEARAFERVQGCWRIGTEAGDVESRLLVGADGARSGVRAAAGIEVDVHEYAQSVVVLHADRPSWQPPDTYVAVLNPLGAVVLVPTTPPGRCRIAVPVPRAATIPREGSVLTRLLADRSPLLADLEPEGRGDSYVYRLARQHARRYAGPSIALVGDAAHVTHPAGGQGMSLAIQDAAALAELLAPTLANGADHDLARPLAAYEHRRRPVNARALAAAHRGSRLGRAGQINYTIVRLALKAAASTRMGRRYLSKQFGGG